MKRVAVLFAFLIITIIILADAGQLGLLHVIYDFQYADKVGHFILFGLLSLFFNLSYLSSPEEGQRLVVRLNLILLLVIGLEELSQAFFPNRTLDIWDLLASWAGVSVFARLAHMTAQRKVTSR